MANLLASTSKRFNPADYKNSPDWFTGRFLSALNLFIGPVYTYLFNGLSFAQNFNAQYFTQVIVAKANPTQNAFTFQSTIQGTPVEIIKASCNVLGNLSSPLTGVDFSWYFSAGVVYITAVSGLVAGTTYNLTLRVC